MTHPDPIANSSTAPEGLLRQQARITLRLLGSLLLGGVAVVGSIALFRQGLLPLIDMVFQPGSESLSAIRRTGMVLAALGGYWAFVHWHEKREAIELKLRPVSLMLAAAGGAVLMVLPISMLFALGAYEMVNYRGFSSSLVGVAVLIGIAALLEELVYRLLLFRLLERAWGTGIALAVSSAIFAVAHMENVENSGAFTVVAMLVSVTMAGLVWGLVFVLTRNLWAATANHAAWNFTILLSGVPLSGIESWRDVALLESRYAGPDWLTGGMFGPECSALVLVSNAIAIALLLWWARRRGAIEARAAY
ncbi:MAG: CPBP family intramembrane glutamic endopeptidase [Burkholderiales bacterium]|nr:CPBP family intramembrane glutamic endopeptidase [Burkholderiales bacterium]